MKDTLRKTTEAWLSEFTAIPASVIEKMAKCDESMQSYTSPSLRLIASPTMLCERCDYAYEGDTPPTKPLESKDGLTIFAACENCGYDLGWERRAPSFFPCGWRTLFVPPSTSWFLTHAEEVARLGLFVFESEDFGVLLGIDDAPLDFYDAYWIPLYRLLIRREDAKCVRQPLVLVESRRSRRTRRNAHQKNP